MERTKNSKTAATVATALRAQLRSGICFFSFRDDIWIVLTVGAGC